MFPKLLPGVSRIDRSAARENKRLTSGSACELALSGVAWLRSTFVSAGDLRLGLVFGSSEPSGSPANAKGAEILEMRPSNVE